MHRVRSASPRCRRVQLACAAIAVLALASPAFAQKAAAPPAPAMAKPVPVPNATPLERMRLAGRIKLGYRTDARPLSYRDESGKPAGYSVELCQRIVEAAKGDLGLAELSIEWVPVTAENRYQALQQGEVDLLCGAESVTLTRRHDVSFSIPIFPGGIGALLRADAPAQLREILSGSTPKTGPVWRGNMQVLQEKTFAVVSNTTAEKLLAEKLAEFKLASKVAPVDGYEQGVQRLLDRKCDVFFGDRAILLDAAKRSPAGKELAVLDRMFTYEPLALALPRGDEDFRLAVDRALSRLYRSGEIRTLYAKWCGEPDANAVGFFQWNALPD
jgi:ABC-type amino acid transport substrate-binding protein